MLEVSATLACASALIIGCSSAGATPRESPSTPISRFAAPEQIVFADKAAALPLAQAPVTEPPNERRTMRFPSSPIAVPGAAVSSSMHGLPNKRAGRGAAGAVREGARATGAGSTACAPIEDLSIGHVLLARPRTRTVPF
jgi:hypothetical protein